jgi:dodecin
VTMSVAVNGGNVTVTGKVIRHPTPSDPGSPLGAQAGVTLNFSGARPQGLTPRERSGSSPRPRAPPSTRASRISRSVPRNPSSRDLIGSRRATRKERQMPGTYKKIQIVGTSPVSFAEAVKNAVRDASATVRHMDWFEVVEMRGRLKDGEVVEFQVTIRIGFKLER